METINDRIEMLVNERFNGDKAAFAKAIGTERATLSNYIGNVRRSKPGEKMKRFLLLTVMMTAFAVSTFAQSVLGIKVGESYSNAKNALRERYGYQLSEDSGNLTLFNFEMGDFSFDCGTLYFQCVDGVARFYRAEFQKWKPVSEAEPMKRSREYLKNKLENKYQIFGYKNSLGYKCYEFIGEEENGVTMYGDITLTRAKGKDNVERLYLILSYDPIADFIQEDSDF